MIIFFFAASLSDIPGCSTVPAEAEEIVPLPEAEWQNWRDSVRKQATALKQKLFLLFMPIKWFFHKTSTTLSSNCIHIELKNKAV